MLIMGFDGTSIDDSSPVNQWLSTDGLGGVLLFDRCIASGTFGKNLRDRQQIIQLTRELAARGSAHWPLFIAIDYEGGAVDRLKNITGCLTTLKPEQLTDLPEDELLVMCQQMAGTLKSLGFNLNFAPVVDLNLNDQDGIIGKLGRSFSSSPFEVIRLAKRFVSVFTDSGISCCYKHFPGHGSASGDSHHGFVDVTDSFQYTELQPYHALLKRDQPAAMVMTAHVINRQLDPTGMPATLSKPVLTGLLRDTIGFDGVIISDDLQMSAISDHFSVREALCLTINAGADMIIFGNQLGSISANSVVDIIEDLVESQLIPLSRIEQAYQRIVTLKRSQMAFA